MKLRELNAHFVGGWSAKGFSRLASVEGAQGILFQCPKCAIGKKKDGDGVLGWVEGAHSILCWFRNPRNAEQVPDDALPGPGRWQFSGETIDDITFTGPDAASVFITTGCGWHGFVKNGDAT